VPEPPDRPPYEAYATILGTFLAGLGLASRLADPERELRAIDLGTLGLATFKGARTLSRDRVASFVREPFVEGTDREGERARAARRLALDD
jgi:hypothetical protein